MISLLKTEWLKIKNYNAFKVLSICFAAGIILTNFIVFRVNQKVVSGSTQGKMLMSSYDPYSFSNTWHTTSYATGWILILPAMIMLILVTNEYTYRTNRQNIIDGWSRQQFIDVKLSLAFILALLSTVLVILTALCFGLISGTDFSMENFSPVGFFFVKALTYNVFAVLISVLVKRSGFAIGLFFIYLGAENLLSLWLYTWSINLKSSGINLGDLGSYLPLSASDSLIPFPDNPMKNITKSISPEDYIWIAGAFAAAYLFLFIWWSRRKYMRTDL